MIRHEWCRLVSLENNRNGPAGVKSLFAAWVQPQKVGDAIAPCLAVIPSLRDIITPTPTPTPQQCDRNSPLLVLDAQGPKVRELQLDLTQLGHSVGPHGIDGKFGPDTRAAAIQFQKGHGLTVDGKVGPQTWGVICDVLSMNNPHPNPTH
jgi:peptidoglycan hydrolase-like protein with peptidoglycan-binding domain